MFKFILHFILIFLFLNLVENSEVNEYLVETKYGTIRGFPLPIEEKVEEKINVKVFLGIPYAKAPINELRFEKPLPPKRWNGVRNATEMGPACFPFIRKGMWVPENEHSEDCLHLNILAPDWQPVDGKPFPVLVYVHGGGFQEGTTREIRPEVLARKYVQEGIVFVTFQYRIGQLGFAATGDEKFAGNYGLWDQKLALEFVRENIDKFGGDPKRVTIWGFSAGSASVSALSISHQTKNLFNQVIQMSGSILGEWAASNRPIGETEKMAKELGCGELLADSAKLKKCLKGKSVHELMDAVEKMGSKRRDLSELLFTPRLDADFFSNEPMHLIHEAPPKRTMIGMTKLECIAFTMFGSDSDDLGALYVSTEKRANFGRKNVEEFVREIVAPEKAFGKEEAKKVQKRILEFYLAEKGEGVEFYLRKYNELLSDLLFLVPILKEARAKTLDGWPIYLYQIDYFNRKYFPENIPVKDSCHAIELPAVFDIRHVPYLIEEYCDEDLAFSRVLVGSIINFVKNGDPSMASFKWPKLSAERPLQYAQLNSNPKMMSPLAAEKLKFWQQIEKEYSFDIIRGIHKITLQSKDEL